ncbi:unnamed protein product, partial [Rhizoctonia solani]
VGLLPRANFQQVPFAYHMYQRDDEEGWEMSNGFKQAFSIDVEIHFMGLFDTVNSVGLISHELPFAKSNYVVRYFRHAVALDERRSKFKDNLWDRTSDQDAALAAPLPDGYVSKRRRERLRKMSMDVRQPTLLGYGTAMVGTSTTEKSEKANRSSRHRHFKGQKDSVAHAIGGKRVQRAETDVEEVWFAGAHTDVGGGSVKNGERYSLARISLRWMVRQCFKCDTGIMFHSNLLEDIGLSPETLWPRVLPRPPPITSLDQIPENSNRTDTLSPVYRSRYTRYPTRSDTTFLANLYELGKATLPGRPDRRYTQLAGKVDPYEPYIPISWRIGRELRDYGPDAWEPREPFISEEVEDFKDALSPIYDQLSLNWWWWILEFIPIKQVWRKKEKGWRKLFGINLGGPRVIKNQKRNGVNVHRTVKIRMETKTDLDGDPFSYMPLAVLKKPWIQWLDGSEENIS